MTDTAVDCALGITEFCIFQQYVCAFSDVHITVIKLQQHSKQALD